MLNLLFCICELKETGGRREAAAPVSLFGCCVGRADQLTGRLRMKCGEFGATDLDAESGAMRASISELAVAPAK